MRKWQAIVFDLDDTLYPEREYVFSGFRAVADWVSAVSEISANDGYNELCQLFEQGVRSNSFDQWLRAHQLDSKDLISQLVEIYREHQPQIHLFSDVSGSLSSLRKRHKLGIISDGYLAVQKRKLEALGIEALFDSIIFSDRWGRGSWKPSDRPFREALAQLESKPELTVYVGDNPLKDFYGARRCGWHTIWIRREGGEYTRCVPPSSSFAPDVMVSSFQQLMEYLCEGSNGCLLDKIGY